MTYHQLCNKSNTTTGTLSEQERLKFSLPEHPSLHPGFCRVTVVHVVHLYVVTYLDPGCGVRYDFRIETLRFVFSLVCCVVNGVCLRILLSNTITISDDVHVFNSKTMGSTSEQELLTIPEHLN